jgi:DNA-binding IclR family transcriptional regulator
VIQSVDRALRILTVLQGGRRMSLGEIAGWLELPASTVHGIIRTLLSHGMVQQERDSGRYRLGPATLRLGNVYLDTLELRARAAPWAESLAQQTGFGVRTGVLLLTDVVVVQHAPRPGGSRQMPEVGIVIPAHASALGKVLLAYDLSTRDQVLAVAADRRSMTGETITDAPELLAQLEEARATGVAREVEEAVLGECVLAAPLAGVGGEVGGALGIVVPARDWPVSVGVVDALRDTARAISRELGTASWPPIVDDVLRLPVNGPGNGPEDASGDS